MFLCTNREFPFCVMRKVVEAAFNAAILYSCESCQAVDKLYTRAIKYLLGVRKTTPNDLCLVEIGISPLAAVVKQKQFNVSHKLINARTGDYQDPFMFTLHMAKTFNCLDILIMYQVILTILVPQSVYYTTEWPLQTGVNLKHIEL